MKCVVLFLPALFLWLIPLAQADWNSLLDQGDGHLIYFGTALEGRSPFRRNADSSMAPASTMKLFTAGAILEKFGTDYRFPTELSWLETGRGQVAQLSLFGYGDPSLGMPEIGEKLRDRFDQFANALANAGVKEVLGLPQAEAGDPRWNALSLPDGWKETDTSSCGGAFGLAFNLGLNCGTLTIHSPSRATWSEEGLNFPVSLRIRESTNTNLEIKFNSAPISFIVEGSWRPGTSPQTFHLPIYDTNSWAANLLRNALISRGIRILPKQEIGRAHV